MAKVIAFSCAHICTPDTAAYLGRPCDYSNVQKLLDVIRNEKPDYIINLGDWQELLYEPDGLATELFPAYAGLEVVKLRGNHDKSDGLDDFEVDGVAYTHGHVLGGSSSRQKALTKLRLLDGKLVHGHTHVPNEAWPLDVGSITYTGTYGVITDGNAELRHA